MGFNLIEEPWIRVIDTQCHVTELPLLEALLNAHKYRALGGESPAQDAAILRLLIAVVLYAVCRILRIQPAVDGGLSACAFDFRL